MSKFEDLKVFQAALDLRVEIHHVTVQRRELQARKSRDTARNSQRATRN